MTLSEEQASWTLNDWLVHLEQLHPTTIDLGLERVREVGQRLQLADLAEQVILVAGTNGKGTTCALLEQLALAAGKTTAVYSSPHFIDYTERLRINGHDCSAADHCAGFAAVEAERNDVALTYFEFGTLAAFWLVKQRRPDVAIIEVGLGGRLDATNILDPQLSIITTVDLDHQAYLGDTREQIGREKAGIMRAHCPAVLGANMPQTVLAAAQQIQADVIQSDVDFSAHELTADHSESTPQWRWHDQQHDWHLPVPQIPVHNAGLALTAAAQLGWLPEQPTVTRVLSALTVLGRWQKIGDQPATYLDVAHNPEAARYLATNIARHQHRRVLAVVGMLTDKDIISALAPLLPLIDIWYTAPLNVPRGDDGTAVTNALSSQPYCYPCESVRVAFQRAQHEAHADDLVVVFGSFHTVAEIYKQGLVN